MNGYDDDWEYDEDYEDEDYDNYDEGGPGSIYYDDDYGDDQPLIPKWRMDLEISKYWLWYRLDNLKRWLKWHNHKCKVCGKPATIDGEVCPNCLIPF